jgi:hypothetical protein
MVEKKTEPRQTSNQGSTPQTVVDLLTSILNEVQKQVQSQPPAPPGGGAQIALDQFASIGAALALQPPPTITLRAEPTGLPVGGGKARLIWSSTDAQTVSIDQNVGDVTPVASGSIEVSVLQTTIFTATAKGACSSRTATATVNVQFVE